MTEDFKCTLLNIWIMFIFPLPTWLLKCTNSYWQFNSNLKSSKCDPQTFPVSRYLPRKTHTHVFTLLGVRVLANLFFFSGKFSNSVASKTLTVFPPKVDSMSCLSELHNYSKEVSLSFDQSFSMQSSLCTDLPSPSPLEKSEKGRLWFSASSV